MNGSFTYLAAFTLKVPAMLPDDEAYFHHRAEVQLALAERAELPQVASAHYRMANAYVDRLTHQRPIQADQIA